MKLTASSLIYIKYSRRETFASLQRLGIPYVDLWDHEGFGSHVSVMQDDSAAVRDDLAEFGLKPAAISLFSTDPVRLAAGFSCAAKIGAESVVVGFSGNNPGEFATFLRPLAEQAADHGVKLMVENHVDTPVDSIDKMKLLVEKAPGVVFCFAPPHSVHMGEHLLQNLTTLGDRMAMFCLWDCPWLSTGLTWFRNNWNRYPEEQVPGCGKLTPLYPAIMDTLRAMHFPGSANFLWHGSREWPIAEIERRITASRRFLGL
jgi:sugar phosphate isomerase/epimerase